MAPTEQPVPPPAADYRGTPLHVGDQVAFILAVSDQPALYTGRIALINKDQVCVESGSLHVVPGKRMKPAGMPDQIRYQTIIRRPEQDGV